MFSLFHFFLYTMGSAISNLLRSTSTSIHPEEQIDRDDEPTVIISYDYPIQKMGYNKSHLNPF